MSRLRRDQRGLIVSFNPALAGLHAQVQVLEKRQKEMQASLRRSFSEYRLSARPRLMVRYPNARTKNVALCAGTLRSRSGEKVKCRAGRKG